MVFVDSAKQVQKGCPVFASAKWGGDAQGQPTEFHMELSDGGRDRIGWLVDIMRSGSTTGMITMQSVLKGVVRGKTIELEQAPNLPDGQKVTVVLEPTEVERKPGDGLREAFGGWSDDIEGLDKYLEWNRQQRKQPTRRDALE
jgi:hypothetical protein